jgi:hypothetical protein
MTFHVCTCQTDSSPDVSQSLYSNSTRAWKVSHGSALDQRPRGRSTYILRFLTVERVDTVRNIAYSSSSSSLARQPYVGPGLPQKLLPAKVSGYCFFRFRDKPFQGGVVSPTPNPRLSWRADVFCQGCLPYQTSPNLKASGSRFLPLHDLSV